MSGLRHPIAEFLRPHAEELGRIAGLMAARQLLVANDVLAAQDAVNLTIANLNRSQTQAVALTIESDRVKRGALDRTVAKLKYALAASRKRAKLLRTRLRPEKPKQRKA